jgi:hypothetical protein
MTWWTGDGHITLPKAVIRLLVEAAMALREQIVQDVYDNAPTCTPRSAYQCSMRSPRSPRSSPSPTC